MHCNDVRERLAAYLDGEVTPEESRDIAAHLAACTGCRDEAQALDSVRSLLKNTLAEQSSRIAPAPQAWEKLKRRIAVPVGDRVTLKSLFRQPLWRVAMPVTLTVLVAAALWGVGIITRDNNGSSAELVMTSTVPPTTLYIDIAPQPPQTVILPEKRGAPSLAGGTPCILPYNASSSTS